MVWSSWIHIDTVTWISILKKTKPEKKKKQKQQKNPIAYLHKIKYENICFLSPSWPSLATWGGFKMIKIFFKKKNVLCIKYQT